MLSVTALETIAAQGWRGTTTARVGQWLLRAADGFTGRANSVLPLGRPECTLDESDGAGECLLRWTPITVRGADA
jgi:hypothetical protein